jgi:hypothetical protein
LRETPFAEAVMVAVWSLLMAAPVTVKFAVPAPAGTTTLEGTVALALLLDSDMP